MDSDFSGHFPLSLVCHASLHIPTSHSRLI